MPRLAFLAGTAAAVLLAACSDHSTAPASPETPRIRNTAARGELGIDFGPQPWVTMPSVAVLYMIDDYTGDGKMDLISFEDFSGLRIGASTGWSFVFGDLAPPLASGWKPVLAGDYTGDGKADLLGYQADMGGAYVSLVPSLGATFGAGKVVSEIAREDPGYDRYTWKRGDFNGDGRLDMFAHKHRTRNVLVGVNTGVGLYIEGWGDPGAGWPQWEAGDFTGDGKDDVLRIYQEYNGPLTLRVGVNRHGFDFGTWGTPTPSDGWEWHSGEFGGDSKPDVLGYHWRTGTLWVGVSEGTRFNFGTYPWATVTPAGGWNWSPVDVTGDGMLDLIGYHEGNGTLWVGRNDEPRFTFGSAPAATVTPAGRDWYWRTGDFTGDGKPDLLGYYIRNRTVWVGTIH